MKQIFKTNQGIRVKDVPIPFPGDNEVQVKVYNSLISVGTEANSMKNKSIDQKIGASKERVDKLLKIIKGQGLKIAYEKVVKTFINAKIEGKYEPIGYSNSGIITTKGKNVINLNVGDRVACGGNTFATHSEFVAVPKNLVVRLTKGVSFEEGAFTTVGSIAMQGIRRSGVKPGEWIIIYGVGLLGLLAVQIAKSWGLHIIAIDINNEKLELAKAFGADGIINSLETKSMVDVVFSLTNGYGADASIIYASTSSSDPVNNSFDLCRNKANIVIVGAVGMELERSVFYRKEQNLIISTSYGPGRYDDEYEIKGHDYPIGYVRWTENRNMQEFINLLDSKRVQIDKLLTSINEVEKANEVYKRLAAPINDEVGVLFRFKTKEKQKDPLNKKIIQINTKPVTNDKINVGVIGAGGYVNNYILPFIKNNIHFNLIGLSNKTTKSSLTIGKSENFSYITGDYKVLLQDESIDLIIIGTKHDLHAKIVNEALLQNKHIFVEKPLSLTLIELEEIIEIVKGSDKQLFIGFNRRYSQLTQKLKARIVKRESPIMINLRINAGNIPLNSWVQDPDIGGGRIIGEACHFIDLCNYIVDSDIDSFDIKSIPVDGKNIIADDNFIITIKYNDNSIANIFYTSIGGSKQPKELLEVYSEGKSYIIDDFIEYYEYSKIDKEVVFLKEQDKGREFQINEIIKSLRGEVSLVPNIYFDFNASLLSIYAQGKLNGIK